MAVIGAIVGILISAVISGVVIWIVGRFNLGLEVDGFGAAFLAAIVIAIISALIVWVWSLLGYSPGAGWSAALINLITAAVVIYAAGSFVPGFKVKGFSGALIAAVAIAIVGWLIGWVMTLFV